MFSQNFLRDRPELAKIIQYFKQNSIFILSTIILICSFLVFFQMGRKDTEQKNANGETMGIFSTPKLDADQKPLSNQSCIVNKDQNCTAIINQNWIANYSQPNNLFWDENYHIASAERYLQGKMFMEPHPALGKLIIALGEKMGNNLFGLNANLDKSKLLGENTGDAIPYVKSIDVKFKDGYIPKKDEKPEYSFAGVRFFPVVMALFCAYILFHLLFHLTKNEWVAFVFSLFYVFDNAIVVHSRGAMLDGIQMFFILCSLLYFVRIWNNDDETESSKKQGETSTKPRVSLMNYIKFGIFVGLAVSTKVNGLILAVLVFVLIFKEILDAKFEQFDWKNKENWGNRLMTKWQLDWKDKLSQNLFSWIKKIVVFFAVVGSIFCVTYYLHFSIARTPIEKNEYSGYTSPETKKILESGKTANIDSFLPQFRDHLNFTDKFQKGVPKWDPTKGNNEAGSLPFTWPVGNKTIRYLASKSGNCGQPYDDKCRFSFSYLIPNMVVWILCLLGILLALVIIFSRLIFGLNVKNKEQFWLITVFASMYLIYMLAMTQIDRVMYLYHYFVPLMFALITTCLVFNYIFEEKSVKTKSIFLSIIAICVVVYFINYAPLTYRFDISVKDFETKNWNKYWALMMDF